jgi:hypothetical protein
MVVPGKVVLDEYTEVAYYCRSFHDREAVHRITQGNSIRDWTMSTQGEGFIKRNEFGFI